MSHLWSLPGILAKQDEPNVLAKPWRIKPEAGWEGNKKAPSRSQRTSEGQTKSTWALTHSVHWSIAGAQRHDWSQGAHEEERVRLCRGCRTGQSLNLYLMTSHLCHKDFGDWEGAISGSVFWNKRIKMEACFKQCGGKMKIGQIMSSCIIPLQQKWYTTVLSEQRKKSWWTYGDRLKIWEPDVLMIPKILHILWAINHFLFGSTKQTLRRPKPSSAAAVGEVATGVSWIWEILQWWAGGVSFLECEPAVRTDGEHSRTYETYKIYYTILQSIRDLLKK